jgi:hypothetical protein
MPPISAWARDDVPAGLDRTAVPQHGECVDERGLAAARAATDDDEIVHNDLRE